MKQALQSHSFKRIGIYLLVVCAVLLVTYFVMVQTIFAKKIHLKRAQKAYNHELSTLNQLLTSYGFGTKAANFVLSCSNLDGDQTVRLKCSTNEQRERLADAEFMSHWQQTYSNELEHRLDSASWVKEPNLDPITKNPVNSLKKLFEYKSTYPADVSYVKKQGTINCWFRVDLAAKESTPSPVISVNEGCWSVIGG